MNDTNLQSDYECNECQSLEQELAEAKAEVEKWKRRAELGQNAIAQLSRVRAAAEAMAEAVEKADWELRDIRLTPKNVIGVKRRIMTIAGDLTEASKAYRALKPEREPNAKEKPRKKKLVGGDQCRECGVFDGHTGNCPNRGPEQEQPEQEGQP